MGLGFFFLFDNLCVGACTLLLFTTKFSFFSFYLNFVLYSVTERGNAYIKQVSGVYGCFDLFVPLALVGMYSSTVDF